MQTCVVSCIHLYMYTCVGNEHRVYLCAGYEHHIHNAHTEHTQLYVYMMHHTYKYTMFIHNTHHTLQLEPVQRKGAQPTVERLSGVKKHVQYVFHYHTCCACVAQWQSIYSEVQEVVDLNPTLGTFSPSNLYKFNASHSVTCFVADFPTSIHTRT